MQNSFRILCGFFRMTEEMVQGSVLPGHIIGDSQFFEATQVFFADRAASILVIRIAIIDATTQWPWLTCRAKIALLKGAKIRRHGRGVIGWCVVQQNLGFEVAEEQGMAIFLEATAASAGDAYGTGGGHVVIDFLI